MRIGIIGFGKRGHSHYSAYQMVRNVRVFAISDPRKTLKRTRPTMWFSNYLDMIKNVELDAVSVCTPTYSHFPIVKKCLMSGLHVLVEKPFTLKQTEADILQKLSKQYNRLCIVGYNLRHDAEILKLHRIIKQGKIGKIIMARCRQAHNWGGKRPFSWHTERVFSGGGTIIDNATHYINLLQTVIGRIKSVTAQTNNLGFKGNVEDSAVVILKHENNVISSIETSWCDVSGRNNQIVIWGSRGVIEFSETNTERWLKFKRWIIGNDEWNQCSSENYYLPKGIEQISKNMKSSSCTKSTNTQELIAQFCKLVISSLNDSNKIKTQERDNTVSIIEAIYRSVKTGKTIMIQ